MIEKESLTKYVKEPWGRERVELGVFEIVAVQDVLNEINSLNMVKGIQQQKKMNELPTYDTRYA